MNKVYSKEESKIVKACVKGSPQAQKQLYDKYSAKMLGVCYRYAKNKQEAEDIFQEGFIRVFRKLNTFKHKGSLEGWIRRVFVNIAIRHYQNSTKLYAITIDDSFGLADENLGDNLNYEMLLEMVNELPDGYRLVFNLYAIEGYSHKEISKELGISEGTSKSQLFRARKELIKKIKQEELSISKNLV